jgi:hypothetical protein
MMQRRSPGLAYQQRHGARRVPGRGQEHQAAVPEQVMTPSERRKAGVVGRCRRYPLPTQSRQVDMTCHEAAQFGTAGLDSVSHSVWLTTISAWPSSPSPPM